ncbi:MAG: AAA family ATPase [Firmicutes bacterium]|nr:AAA family ATPase [Bacillota bacterium]
MDKETAKDFWTKIIGLVSSGNGSTRLDDPQIELSVRVKAGLLEEIPDGTFIEIKDCVDELSSIWQGMPSASASELLVNALKLTDYPEGGKQQLADLLSEFSAATGYEPYSPKSVREARRVAAAKLSLELASDPRKIFKELGHRVVGQDEARRAASMLIYNHLRGRRSNALFYGPTGCGKTEIWRAAGELFPDLVSVVDASRLAPEGWRGGTHLRDIFDGIPGDRLRRYGRIVVLDEADKVFCETIVSGNGTDHSALLQSTLLKMLDGDMLSFGAEDALHPAFSVDCDKVSVVLLGTFEKLLEKRARAPRSIGFGAAAVDAGSSAAEAASCETERRGISYADLIGAGMRREIAGRIGRIAALDPLSVSDYRNILELSIMAPLEMGDGPIVEIDEASAELLAEEAASSGLGVRLMRSRVMNALDELIFEDPGAERYLIDLNAA